MMDRNVECKERFIFDKHLNKEGYQIVDKLENKTWGTFIVDNPQTLQITVDLLNQFHCCLLKPTPSQIIDTNYREYVGSVKEENIRLKSKIHELEESVEYYKKYAIKYLLNFDLFTDDFLQTLESIEGKEGVDKIRKKQEEVIEALKKEGLWEEGYEFS